MVSYFLGDDERRNKEGIDIYRDTPPPRLPNLLRKLASDRLPGADVENRSIA